MSRNGTKRVAILVTGAHRSGTSALTRVLNIAGCDLPRTLMKPQPDNAEGFWESQAIMDLNQEILKSAGSSWDDWRPFDQGWYASPIAGDFRERGREIVQSEFSDSRLFVLKDPRMCRLLEFWIEIVRECGALPLVVAPIRNPLDVASSLHVRNDIDPFVGQLIWLRHVLDAEAASRGVRNRAYLRYEQLLSEAHAVLDRLGSNLGVSWPKVFSPYAEMEIEGFLSPVLHHHSSDDTSYRSNPHLSEWIKTSFDIFDRWSRGDMRKGDIPDLDRIKAAFDVATPAFSRAMAAGQAAGNRSRQLLSELEKLRRETAEREERIQALSEEREEQNQALSEQLEVSRQETAQCEQYIRTLYEELEYFGVGHIMALAHRRSRFGLEELEVGILLNPHWLDQAGRSGEREPVLELRLGGRRVARLSIRSNSDNPVRMPVRARAHTVSDALYSIHDGISGEVLAAIVTPPLRQARRTVGAVESRERAEVRGWALDPRSPNRRRRIAIHVDGDLRQVVIAEQHRADIARWKRTGGHHGFRWPIPDDVAARSGVRLDVFDADTGVALRGSPLRIEGGRVIRSGRHEA